MKKILTSTSALVSSWTSPATAFMQTEVVSQNSTKTSIAIVSMLTEPREDFRYQSTGISLRSSEAELVHSQKQKPILVGNFSMNWQVE